MTFQPKNFIRLEWDGEELTCYGRRGNGEEEPWTLVSSLRELRHKNSSMTLRYF